MMEEDKRKEAQKRLTEEERVRRLREGGESMKAELAMEEAQRSSREAEGGGRGDYLTSQEEQQRQMMMRKGEPYRGYGESQQTEMAMWGKKREGGEKQARPEESAFRAGSGSYYSETFEKPTGSAGPESSFGRTERTPSGKQYAEPPRREMSQDEMRRAGSDRVGYEAGRGSYYTETFEKPIGSAGPESSFGRTERTPSGKEYAEGGMGARREEVRPSGRNISQEEMRRTGSDQVGYPAGGGSYYTETFERPVGSAGPESSFGRTERVPSGKQYAESVTMQGRMGAYPTQETGPTSKMGQKAEETTGMMKEKGGEAMAKGKEYGEVAVAKGKEVGGTAVTKTREAMAPVASKAKEYTEGTKAEDSAHRAGVAIGKALRKAASVVSEMGSGLRKGLGREHEEPKQREQAEMPPERMEEERVEKEVQIRETPTMEEKKYQETRRKENP